MTRRNLELANNHRAITSHENCLYKQDRFCTLVISIEIDLTQNQEARIKIANLFADCYPAAATVAQCWVIGENNKKYPDSYIVIYGDGGVYLDFSGFLETKAKAVYANFSYWSLW